MASASYDEFRLVSPGIPNDGKLPRKYTGDGQAVQRDISPPLEWYNVPEGTKSLALVVQDVDQMDPDGPVIPWAHWVVLNIPPTLKDLPEGFSGKENVMEGEYTVIQEGINGWKEPRWRGPKLPTLGHQLPAHRLEFKLYALDDEFHLGHKVTKERLEDEIGGHVLGEAIMLAHY